jgi:hypothetical protein
VSRWKRHLWIATVAGLLLSGALGGINLVTSPDRHPALSRVAFFVQFPGWLALAYILPGSFESINTANYLAVAVPVNAVLYTILIFVILRVFRRKTRR